MGITGKEVAPLQPVGDHTSTDTPSRAHGGPHAAAAAAGALQEAAALAELTLEQEPRPVGDPQRGRFALQDRGPQTGPTPEQEKA